MPIYPDSKRSKRKRRIAGGCIFTRGEGRLELAVSRKIPHPPRESGRLDQTAEGREIAHVPRGAEDSRRRVMAGYPLSKPENRGLEHEVRGKR